MPEKIGQILVRKKIISEFDLKVAMERKEQEPDKYLGQILCEMGLPQSKIIKTLYSSNKRKPFGQILVDRETVTSDQLQEKLHEQKALKKKGIFVPLGVLLSNSGIISDESYVEALAAHFSMPIVSLKNHKLSVALQQIIGEEYAAKNRIVVLRNTPGQLTVAVGKPNLMVFDHLEAAMPKGKSILFCLAKSSEIEICLDRTYDPFANERFKY